MSVIRLENGLSICKNLAEQLHTKQSLCRVHMTHCSCAKMTWKHCIFRLKFWHEWWHFIINLHLTIVKFHIQSHSIYVNVESLCRLFDLISCNCAGWHVAQDYFCCSEARRKEAKDLVSFPLSFSHFQPFSYPPSFTSKLCFTSC